MKNIFLFDPTCLPYRVNVYEYLREQFQKKGFNLTVFFDPEQTEIVKEGFKPLNYSFISFLRLHREHKPDVSIFFIWLRYKFSLFFLIYTRFFLKTKSIVWSKGVNISKIDQPIKNTLYYIRQFSADALVLYSDFEKQFIKSKMNKVFVANNTINQHKYNLNPGNSASLRKKYGIKQDKVVLFVGRIQGRKRLDLLVDIFSNDIKTHALLIVGPGMTEERSNKISKNDNIYYLGPIYDTIELSKIYSLSSVSCIPGEVGLGVNEAFLFGLPIVTTYIRPTSEMKLLFSDGENGLLFENGNQEDLKEKLLRLLSDKELLEKFSKKAKKSFEEKGKIEYMFDGFLNSVNFVLKNE